MTYKNRFFISILISFILLMFSLYLSYSNISVNNNMIKYIEKDQIRLSYIANKLNYDIKKNQTSLLQIIMLNKELDIQNINKSFNDLNNVVDELSIFKSASCLK